MLLEVVPAHTRTHIRLPHPEDAFSRAYRHILPESDFECILTLIKNGEVDVVVHPRTRAVALIPSSQAEAFVNAVFRAFQEDHPGVD